MDFMMSAIGLFRISLLYNDKDTHKGGLHATRDVQWEDGSFD